MSWPAQWTRGPSGRSPTSSSRRCADCRAARRRSRCPDAPRRRGGSSRPRRRPSRRAEERPHALRLLQVDARAASRAPRSTHRTAARSEPCRGGAPTFTSSRRSRRGCACSASPARPSRGRAPGCRRAGRIAGVTKGRSSSIRSSSGDRAAGARGCSSGSPRRRRRSSRPRSRDTRPRSGPRAAPPPGPRGSGPTRPGCLARCCAALRELRGEQLVLGRLRRRGAAALLRLDRPQTKRSDSPRATATSVMSCAICARTTGSRFSGSPSRRAPRTQSTSSFARSAIGENVNIVKRSRSSASEMYLKPLPACPPDTRRARTRR